jgi:hypothetical protein
MLHCQLIEVVNNRRTHCAVSRFYCGTVVIVPVNDTVGGLHGIYV